MKIDDVVKKTEETLKKFGNSTEIIIKKDEIGRITATYDGTPYDVLIALAMAEAIYLERIAMTDEMFEVMRKRARESYVNTEKTPTGNLFERNE